ncbi:MAG: sugar phosphate nucleotidyltransferase [Candidatus Moraniibacteriota bacterium]
MRIVILAGGGGSRLWPMSRNDMPKQFCKLISDKTMFEETLERFKEYPTEKIYIATTKDLLAQVMSLVPEFPKENIIVEPGRRDTGPAMGYAATFLNLIDEDEPIAFIPSDHYIGRTDRFLSSIREAENVIKETGKMLDISIYPTSPNTALGYTKIGERKFEKNGVEFYEFLAHKEKPDFATAKKYIEDGNYLWHANYYMWTPKKFLEAYEKNAPELYSKLKEIAELMKAGGKESEIKKIYLSMDKISIDYAVTEKMNPSDVLIIQGEFEWKDIGAWDTLHENMLTKTDERRNLVRGERLNIDTSGCIIYGGDKKLIATVGLDDLVIIDTEDALLICPKGRSQEVKKVVEELKERGGKYL